jgi:transposase InsO family protein
MSKKEQDRVIAVKRYLSGERWQSVCSSLGYGKTWLYKWVERYNPNNPDWYKEESKHPYNCPSRTKREIEEIVKFVRLNLYNQDLFCGAQAIQWEMESLGVAPIPSVRTINRILRRNDLTHRRTGNYEPKGKAYPRIDAQSPNDVHQADLVGPLYLTGPIKFYSLNVVDIITARCGIHPVTSKTGQAIISAFWAIWGRLGMPKHVQVDNEMCFYGGTRYPRGMGPLIRLCLHHRIEPIFIPQAEPWRNGVIEKFNDHYQQKFLRKVEIYSFPHLIQEGIKFEAKHNALYRYSKLNGKTPCQALKTSSANLTFPSQDKVPKYPLVKPIQGKYTVVRFIRSDGKLNIFGELFSVPSYMHYEYVKAIIDVKEQKLKLVCGNLPPVELNYKLR